MRGKEPKLQPFVYTGKAHEVVSLGDEEITLGLREAMARAGLYGFACGERLAHEREIDQLTAEVRFRANDIEKARKDLEGGEVL